MKTIFLHLLLFLSLGLAENTYAQTDEPRFPGCADATDVDCADMKMMQFVFSNLHHPEKAKDAGIEGDVIVSFTVKASGELTDIKIVEGLGYGCDEEVIRLINLMPQWLPAEAEGAAVDMAWEIDVKFTN